MNPGLTEFPIFRLCHKNPIAGGIIFLSFEDVMRNHGLILRFCGHNCTAVSVAHEKMVSEVFIQINLINVIDASREISIFDNPDNRCMPGRFQFCTHNVLKSHGGDPDYPGKGDGSAHNDAPPYS